jgi:hypothetical protein
MHNTEGHEQRERCCACHLDVLRDQQNPPSLGAVRDHAADEGKEEDRNPCQKLIQPEQKGRMAQAVNEPSLCDDLHPGANARSARPDPHQAEISVLKCLEYSVQRRRSHELRADSSIRHLSSHERASDVSRERQAQVNHALFWF